MMKNNRKTNVRLGAIISYFLLVFNVIAHILYTPYLLSKVGDIQYGIFAFVSSITSWFTIALFALNDSFVKFSAQNEVEKGNSNSINTIYIKLMLLLDAIAFVAGSIIFVLFLTGVIPLSKYNNVEQNIIFVLFIISLAQIIICAVLSIFRLFNEFKEKFILVKFLALLEAVLNLGLSLIVLFFGGNIVLIAIVQLIVSIVILSLHMIYAFKKQKMHFDKVKLKDNKVLISSIIGFSSFLLINTLINELNTSVDKMILGFFAGAVYVTNFQLAFSFQNYIIGAATAVNVLFVPAINKNAAKHDHASNQEIFDKVSLFQSVIYLFVFGGFLACGKEFVIGWVGEEKIIVYYLTIAYLFIMSFPTCTYSSKAIQRANFKHKIPALLYLIFTIINVGISVLLVVIFPISLSYYACLIGTAFSIIICHWIVIPIYNHRKINLSYKKSLLFFIETSLVLFIAFLISHRLYEILNLSFKSIWFVFLFKGFVYVCVFATVIIASYFLFFKKEYGGTKTTILIKNGEDHEH